MVLSNPISSALKVSPIKKGIRSRERDWKREPQKTSNSSGLGLHMGFLQPYRGTFLVR